MRKDEQTVTPEGKRVGGWIDGVVVRPAVTQADERGVVLREFVVERDASVSFVIEPAPGRWASVRLLPSDLRALPLLHSGRERRTLHYRVLGLHVGPAPQAGQSEGAAWWRLDPAFAIAPASWKQRVRWWLRGLVRSAGRPVLRLISRRRRSAV